MFNRVRSNFPTLVRSNAIQTCIRCVDSIPWEKFFNMHRFFTTPKFWLSLEFCALARPGPGIMNSESVSRHGASLIDSESADRQRSSVTTMKKMKIFQEQVELSKESTDFKKKFRFQKKVQISRTSWDPKKKSRFQKKSRDFKKQSGCQGKVAISRKS